MNRWPMTITRIVPAVLSTILIGGAVAQTDPSQDPGSAPLERPRIGEHELPVPLVGRLTPELIEWAQRPTGKERPEELRDCIEPGSATEPSGAQARGGDWCPLIFNQIDTAHYVRGTTLIWHILVNHAGGSFEQDEIDLVGGRAAQAKQYYRDRAPSNAWVRFDHDDASGFYYYNPTLPYVIDFEDGNPVDDDWVNDACIALGVMDQNGNGAYTDDLTLGLQSWVGWDNVIAVFQPADVWLRGNASVERGACQVPPFESWAVYAHEWGHCFGACDEYEENGGCNGNDCLWICQSCYLNDEVPNGNCEVGPCPTQTCLMKSHESGGLQPPCSFTERNWAWVDGDDDGLLDNTIWNRDGNAEQLWQLFHQGWMIHTNTNWGMVANQQWHSWGAIGVRARDASTKYRIDVYGDNNHRWDLASSDLNTRVNFVVGDFNHNNLGEDHIRLTREFGSAQYVLNYENGGQLLYPDGVERARTWGDREVVRAYDVPLFKGESVRFDLDILTAGLDLGMALFRSNGNVYYAGRGDAVAISASGGPGIGEQFVYEVPDDDVYGLIIFANSEVDGDWEIQIGPNPGQLFDETPVLSSLDLGLYYYDVEDFYWSVVAARPDPGKNVKISLYEDAAYQTHLATSGAYPNVEFIAADYHPNASTDHVRVVRQGGAGSQKTEWEQSPDILDGRALSNFAWTQVAKVWDVYLRAGQQYFFRNYDAGLDTGIYLVSSADGDRYISRSGATKGSNGNPPGEGNWFFHTPAADDWYGAVVIKENDSTGPVIFSSGPYYPLAERVPEPAPERVIYGEFPENDLWVVVGGRAEGGGVGSTVLWDCDDFDSDCHVVASGSRDVSFVAVDAHHVDGPDDTFYFDFERTGPAGENTVSFDDAHGQTLVYDDPSAIVVGEDEWSEGEVVQIWQLDAIAPREQPLDLEIMVIPLIEGLDLGVSFVSSVGGMNYVTSDGPSTPVNAGGPGEREMLSVQIANTDNYGIVVTNHNGASGPYEIVIGSGGPTSDVETASLPADFDFRLVGANPSPDVSRFQLALPTASDIEIVVFDVQGRAICSLQDGPLGAGLHELAWDGRDDAGRGVGSGIYFVRSSAGDERRNLKVLRTD